MLEKKKKKLVTGSSSHDAAETNPTSNQEDVGLIRGLDQWVKDTTLLMSCGVGHRSS